MGYKFRTKREAIIDLFLQRIKDGLDIKPIRGFGGAEVTKFPSIYVFEDTCTVEKNFKRPRLYIKHLPLVLEYFDKARRSEESYEKGNHLLYDIQIAIEKDLDFGGCVMGYKLLETNLLLFKENVIDVSVTYEFTYSERFGGPCAIQTSLLG